MTELWPAKKWDGGTEQQYVNPEEKKQKKNQKPFIKETAT